MTDFREQFQTRFAATAHDRLRRALAALSADPVTVYNELHSLAGEAGILGFSEISTAASAGQQLTRTWRTTSPTSDQQLQCARLLRSLLTLVNALGRPATAKTPAAAVAPRRALVVDDSELVGEELAEALAEAGFEVTTATTMDAALSSARAASPDVVLVDANIPGVELPVLCARLREHARRAKLLIVSASTDDELRRYADAVGADGFVGKVSGTSDIISRVQQLLANGAS